MRSATQCRVRRAQLWDTACHAERWTDAALKGPARRCALWPSTGGAAGRHATLVLPTGHGRGQERFPWPPARAAGGGLLGACARLSRRGPECSGQWARGPPMAFGCVSEAPRPRLPRDRPEPPTKESVQKCGVGRAAFCLLEEAAGTSTGGPPVSSACLSLSLCSCHSACLSALHLSLSLFLWRGQGPTLAGEVEIWGGRGRFRGSPRGESCFDLCGARTGAWVRSRALRASQRLAARGISSRGLKGSTKLAEQPVLPVLSQSQGTG